jgi:hypothetical protein
MKNYILSINDSDRTLLSSLIWDSSSFDGDVR